MRMSIRKWGKWGVIGVLLLGLDLTISLPIMGATYRPFSWMSVAPADAATLYPVIQNLSFENGKPNLLIDVTPGTIILQRSTNLLSQTAWTDVATSTATANGQVIHLIDTNPVTRAVFYRVKHILAGAP